MLLEHVVRLAASRTFCTAGNSRPMRMAMIAITTRSSIRVNARRDMVHLDEGLLKPGAQASAIIPLAPRASFRYFFKYSMRNAVEVGSFSFGVVFEW